MTIDESASKRSAGFRGILTLVGKNSGARAATLPLTAAANLLVAHIIIGYPEGARAYAFYSVLLALVSILAILDLGVGAALTNRFADGESAHAEDIEAGSVRLQSLMGAALALLAILAASVGWLDEVMGLSRGAGEEVAGILTVVGAYALSLPLNLAASALLGSGRSHLAVLTQAASAPASAVVIAAMTQLSEFSAAFTIALGLSVGIVAPRVIASILASTIVGFHIFRRRYWALPWGSSFRLVMRTSGPMLIIMVTQPIAMHSDRLILGYVRDYSELAEYGLSHQLYTPIHGVLAASGLAMWPYLRRPGAAAAELKASRWVMLVMGTCGATALIATSPFLIHLVGHGRIEVPRSLIWAFACLLVVQAIQLPLGMLFTSPSGLRLQAKLGVGMLATNLALTVVGAELLGAIGCVFASIVAIGLWQLLPLHILAHRRAKSMFLN